MFQTLQVNCNVTTAAYVLFDRVCGKFTIADEHERTDSVHVMQHLYLFLFSVICKGLVTSFPQSDISSFLYVSFIPTMLLYCQ